MSDKAPNYFVQTADGKLHGYFRADILCCDLSAHKGEAVKLFRLLKTGFTVSYVPMTESEIRGEMAVPA